MELGELGGPSREEGAAQHTRVLAIELDRDPGHQIGSSKSGRRVGP